MARKSPAERARNEGFSDGVILALQVLTASGNMGSADYEEILKSAGAVEVYRRAEDTAFLRNSGLHDYVRQEFHEPSIRLLAELAKVRM